MQKLFLILFSFIFSTGLIAHSRSNATAFLGDARLTKKTSNGLEVSAGPLFLKAGYSDNAFASKEIQPTQGNANTEKLYDYFFNYQWGWGLHLSMGMGFDDYQSTLLLKYMHYSKATNCDTGILSDADILTIASSSTALSDAHGIFKVTRNRLDAVTESNLDLTKALSLKTSMGLRNEWNKSENQSWGTPVIMNPDQNSVRKNIELSKLWGIGPYLGINPLLSLGYGVKVGPVFGYSLLYSRIKYHELQVDSMSQSLYYQGYRELCPEYDAGFFIGWDYKITRKEYLSCSLEYISTTLISKFEANQTNLKKLSLYGLKSSLQYTF